MSQYFKGQRVLKKEGNYGELWISGRKFVVGSFCIEYIKVPEKIIHKHWEIEDSPQQQIAILFEQTTEFIEKYRKIGKNVLIHCIAGMSRSAAIIIAYLMKKGKISKEKAQILLRNSRPFIKINNGFDEQLKQFEKKLRQLKPNL